MQSLKLEGRLSFIDKYKKLHFVWTVDQPKYVAKLNKKCPDGVKPWTKRGFIVSPPPNIKTIPDDIKSRIGLDCIVYVSISQYDFVSNLEKNKGERISGSRLILSNIYSHPKYLHSKYLH